MSELDTIKQKLEELRRLMPEQAGLLAEIEKKAAEESTKAKASSPASQEEAKQEAEAVAPAKPAVPKAWESLKIARASDRPHGLQFISGLTEDFLELHGDRAFADDQAVAGGLAMFRGRPVTVICTEKGRAIGQKIKRNFGMPHPEGYRKAMRLMEQAARFHRPVICIIDTSGAYCGIGAEERGQGQAIAWNLQHMGSLPVPVISIVIGEAFSGGALALGVCDRLIMMENSVYSVITPEGCASILWKDPKKAPEVAEALKLTPSDLVGLGICDRIVPEPPGGLRAGNMAPAVAQLGDMIEEILNELCSLDADTLLALRYRKYRSVGVPQ
jgi:acetyl-CoA carboxylase carboxyl transferase subunit alpha